LRPFHFAGSLLEGWDDVADEEVPDFVRKYAVTETSGNGEAGSPAGSKARTGSAVEAVAPTPKLRQLRKRYVKRGVAWRRVKDVAVKVGEPIFIRLGPSRYQEIGRVSSDGKLPVERLGG
jgi:hypothetical protein